MRSWLSLAVAVFGAKIELTSVAFSLFFVVFLPIVLHANETNEDRLHFTVQDPVTLGNANTFDVLVYRFSHEIVDSDRTVFDQVSGPSPQLGFLRSDNRLGGAAYERMNGRGVRLFTTMASDSLRIAAVDALPLDSWQDGWLHWLGKLVTGAIGNPAEQHAGLTSPSYSAVRTSWENFSNEAGVQWGIRPWNTYPYIYALAHAGRMEGKPLLIFESRAGYRFFEAPRIEARLTIQLPASFRIASGVGFDPSHAAQQKRGGTEYSITLEKVLRPHSPYYDAMFFLGCRSGINTAFSSSRRETVALAGVATGW